MFAGEAATGLVATIAIISLSPKAKLAEELGIQFNAEALRAKGLQGVLKDVVKATGGNIQKMNELVPLLRVRAVIALANGDRCRRSIETSLATGKVDKHKEMSGTMLPQLVVSELLQSLIQG